MSDEYKFLIPCFIVSFLIFLFAVWESLSVRGLFVVLLIVFLLAFVVEIGKLRISNQLIASVAKVVSLLLFYATLLLFIAIILLFLIALCKSFSWGGLLVLLVILGLVSAVYAETKTLTNKALLRLIKKTAIKKKKTLTICHCKLKRLPHQIGQLTGLTSLDIRRNNLRFLPSEIGKLTHLQYFDISRNRLKSLPSEIGQLIHLQYFDISRNRLKGLPSEIGQLTKISYLDISGNQLKSLPSEIGQLTHLSLLHISHSEATSLPLEIQQMTKLELYVNGVRLTKKYKKCHPSRWSTEWLLSERNAELRRLLIQVIGYNRICQELQVTQLDAWREYTLLKIDARVDVEKICLLKMTCPSTGYIYVVRVPPNIESAREAIKWVNWGIDPEEFLLQT